jgi:UDP-N-acetylmuramate dehydrogenase
VKAPVSRVLTSLVGESEADALRAIFGERVHFDHALAPYTSWKIGGPADAFAEVEGTEELGAMLQLAQKRRLPWFVLGSGSNLLVGDGGVRGIVVRLGGAFSTIAVTTQGEQVVVEAGASASMALVTTQAASQGALGIGSLAGIPGSVG